jgi:putative CocE/NonD family hydrolase
MTVRSMEATRPSVRQRIVDGFVGRMTKIPGNARSYRQLKTSVPMGDGASLLADVYLPDQPKATVLIRSPYGRGFPLDLLHARVFARHGYQVVLQSVRGRTGSSGEFQPVVNEAADGLDTVEWLRAQDWYAGRLATFGGSYLGLAQWALLTQPPEECGAAVIVVGPHDFSRAVWRDRAFALTDIYGWSHAMTAPEDVSALRKVTGMRQMQRQAAAVVEGLPVLSSCQQALAGGAPWFRDWVEHDDLSDVYWDGHRAVDALKNSEVPTLLIGGWRDAFIDQTLEQYDALNSRGVTVGLTVGPWTHMETATKAAVHVTRDAVDWLDHCFVASPRPSKIRAFVTGLDEWRSIDDWPPSTSTLELRLADQRLIEGADDGGETTFVFDPSDPTPAVGGRALDPTVSGAKDNRALVARADVVAFTGDECTAAIEIAGSPDIELTLTAANPHCDVFVRLCDVDPKGRSINISDGFVRLDAGIPAGREQSVHLTLDPCWHQVKPRHRLQLLIAGGAHPRYARNLGTPDSLGSSAVEPQPRTILHRGTTLRIPVISTG